MLKDGGYWLSGVDRNRAEKGKVAKAEAGAEKHICSSAVLTHQLISPPAHQLGCKNNISPFYRLLYIRYLDARYYAD
jgi:hypothetical protein